MNSPLVEKFGTFGAFLFALACPICFPKLVVVGAALGLGAFAPYEGYLALAVQALFVVALIGQIFAYRTHRKWTLVALSGAATATLFAGYYVVPSSTLIQVALAGLVAASVWQIVALKRCEKCAEGGGQSM
jgi:mercuric ion transport protein